MNPDAMVPFGQALLDYAEGFTDAELRIRRDDGLTVPVRVSSFFRSREQFSEIEREALDRCSGLILDVGAGSGLHSLILQERGFRVRALDINSHAVEVMRRRGVFDVQQMDIFEYAGEPCDTLLMLGHGIGMVEELEGLTRFLRAAHRFVRPRGQILIDSMDVTCSKDPLHTAYHEARRKLRHYVGQTRIRFEYRDLIGPECGWLHVDPDTLAEQAQRTEWLSTTLLITAHGEHLTRLEQMGQRR
jgi:SAM-dependent methyltransferase